MATNCDGITIKNNTITNPFLNGVLNSGEHYSIHPNAGIFVGMSKNVTVTGNTVFGGDEVSQAVQIDGTCIAGTIFNSNNILNKNNLNIMAYNDKIIKNKPFKETIKSN